MSSQAIAVRDEKIETLQNRLQNLRRSANAEAAEIMGTSAGLAAAYGYGAMEKRAENRGAALASPIDGVDAKIVYGAGLFIAGRMTGGDAGNALQNAGRAILTIKAYQAGRESAGTGR